MSAPLRILLVEDSEDDAALILRELRRGGYDVTVTRVEDAAGLTAALDTGRWDLVIGDHHLPGFDSFEALALLHQSGRDLPFLLVTGTIGEENAAAAMKAGADDFILKDHLSRLVPAVERGLREAAERGARREAELALGQGQRRFRALIENASDLVLVITRQGEIVYQSPSSLRILGYRPGELTGVEARALAHPDDAPRLSSLFADVLPRPSATRSAELRIRRRDGSWRVLDVTFTNLLDDPDVAGIVINGRDVTERKEAEESLRQSNARLQETLAELQQTQRQVIQQERLRALGEMASGIAHDFNNSLAQIVGYLELLLEVRPGDLERPEVARDYLTRMRVAASDAGAVVRRLREFYRPSDAEEFAPVDLNGVVRQAITLTEPAWRDQARARDVAIEVAASLEEIPPILGDESELREALTNLILNAVAAIPSHGTISLGTTRAGEQAVLSVGDTGTGMSEEVRQRCFEPFFSTKGAGGSGLGLAMVYGIVQRHGGTIEIASAPGRGTTFTIRLPTSARHRPRPASTPRPGHGVAPLRVLVVEDEPGIRQIVAAYLEADGHLVATAEDGRAGLLAFHHGTFDLVIADRAMPEMNGDRLAAAIKWQSPTTPIILLTGFGDLMRAAGETVEGIDRIVAKPVDARTLRQAVADVIQSARGPAPSPADTRRAGG